MMRLDSHQHFWRYSAAEYPWMQPEWPIRRDFLPIDLAPHLHSCGLEGCIAVQARQTLEETRWLLELADASRIVRGVVGWVDLRAPEIEEQLARFATHPKFLGVRHVVQDEPDDDFLRGADFQRGIGKLHAFDLAYDLLIFPRQLRAATALARSFPKQRFVLDHLAKPPVADGALEPWRKEVRALAAEPNVMCKVSGLVTEGRWHAWKPEDFRPYLDTAFEAFGPDRVMFGSDWPVALLAADYAEVFALAADYIATLDAGVAANFFGLNAARFYRPQSPEG